ncbi:hypothetical protein E2C01_031507 [Portunus trituberculatus]|uniref:Uncharacterized protein n=1 Tax=Portunus trituberculatus TaxID=210409 RepID=A0A5B7EYB0_PORTR|nr:hypothetical protein [Portunus trituberculatus]
MLLSNNTATYVAVATAVTIKHKKPRVLPSGLRCWWSVWCVGVCVTIIAVSFVTSVALPLPTDWKC